VFSRRAVEVGSERQCGCSRSRASKASRTSGLCRAVPQLQVPAVAGPRNQLYRYEKVARFWRPSCFLGGSQHRGQIPSQFDPELALIRHHDDRIISPRSISEASRRVSSRWSAAARSDFRSVEVGHAWMQQGRRLIRGFELLRKHLLAVTDRDQLVLTWAPGTPSMDSTSFFLLASIRASSR
jgi:hypothetical protein